MFPALGAALSVAALVLLLTFGAGAARADDLPTITITIKNHQFQPAEVTAPARQKIKITVKNQNDTSAEFESSDFHREKVILPGGEIVVFVGPLDAGKYEFFDDFHPATRGHLTVK